MHLLKDNHECKEALIVADETRTHSRARASNAWGLTAGPGSPFSPGGPSSSEKAVDSRRNIWRTSVAAVMTERGEVASTSWTLLTFGSGVVGAPVAGGSGCSSLAGRAEEEGKSVTPPEGFGESASLRPVALSSLPAAVGSGSGGVPLVRKSAGLADPGGTDPETSTAPGFRRVDAALVVDGPSALLDISIDAG